MYVQFPPASFSAFLLWNKKDPGCKEGAFCTPVSEGNVATGGEVARCPVHVNTHPRAGGPGCKYSLPAHTGLVPSAASPAPTLSPCSWLSHPPAGQGWSDSPSSYHCCSCNLFLQDGPQGHGQQESPLNLPSLMQKFKGTVHI